MRSFLFYGIFVVFLLGSCPVLWAESMMSQEQLENFFTQQKRGTPLQLTLDKGRVIKGLFSSYDDYYETVWLVPQGVKGVFNQKGYKLTGIRNVVLWDRKAASVKGSSTPKETVSDDYYLLKESGVK